MCDYVLQKQIGVRKSRKHRTDNRIDDVADGGA